MGMPSSPDARLFYRCAFQRFDEARILQKAAQRTAGPVYLAGYCIECILKALILEALPAASRAAMLATFRGNRAHDFEWLRERYFENGGARFPAEVTRQFTLVNDWSTELRYKPRSLRSEEVDAFLDAAAAILRWADERI